MPQGFSPNYGCVLKIAHSKGELVFQKTVSWFSSECLTTDLDKFQAQVGYRLEVQAKDSGYMSG
jgi:hypothetical protein